MVKSSVQIQRSLPSRTFTAVHVVPVTLAPAKTGFSRARGGMAVTGGTQAA